MNHCNTNTFYNFLLVCSKYRFQGRVAPERILTFFISLIKTYRDILVFLGAFCILCSQAGKDVCMHEIFYFKDYSFKLWPSWDKHIQSCEMNFTEVNRKDRGKVLKRLYLSHKFLVIPWNKRQTMIINIISLNVFHVFSAIFYYFENLIPVWFLFKWIVFLFQ